ncbi:MAG: sensor histidine kinase [Chloroflexota bacterium]
MGIAAWPGWRLDVGIGVGLAALAVAEVLLIGPSPADDQAVPVEPAREALAIGATVILALSLAVRRRLPILVLVIAIIASAIATGDAFDGPAALIAAIALASFSAGSETTGRQAAAAAAGVGLLLAATALRPSTTIEEPADLAAISLLAVAPWLAGVALRQRREHAALLAVRADELERDQETRAAVAVADERLKIARELHDVVAHAVTVIVLQARAARRTLEHDRRGALEAIDAIEASGTTAMSEMRRLTGVLRDPIDLATNLAPAPSLADLAALTAVIRAAGLPVEVRVDGEAAELPHGLDLTAYRIVQEALTNALAHGGARATVVVRCDDAAIDLEVTDVGPARATEDGEGRGLVGLRERVEVFGGRLEAGARPGGRFVVRAWLPRDTAENTS